MINKILENIATCETDTTMFVVKLVLYLKALEEQNDMASDLGIKHHTLTRDKENDTFTLSIYDCDLETHILLSRKHASIMVYLNDNLAYKLYLHNNNDIMHTTIATYYYDNPQALQA